MRPLSFVLCAAALAALAAAPPAPQAPTKGPGRGPVRGGPNAVTMLRHKAVQEELKLTNDQREKVKGLMTGMRDKLLDLIESGARDKVAGVVKEQEKGLAKVLTARQLARLRQVVLQAHGVWALTAPDTAKELKITPEQAKKLRVLQDETYKEMSKVSESAKTRTEAQKRLAELHRAANDKGLRLLSAEQRARYKALSGEPFKGEIQRALPGEGRPRPRPG
jgi:Spy/CpxP family protein refolding chaperone